MTSLKGIGIMLHLLTLTLDVVGYLYPLKLKSEVLVVFFQFISMLNIMQ